jgi:hypothetical protein
MVFIKNLEAHDALGARDKVATGRSPVAPATLETESIVAISDGLS